jgi:DNA (cytosine-5)-methyltransferase 1
LIKLGSLFSGSGGFELAGVLVGMVPVWCSEIEKFPVAVEAARFPDCKQLGDVREIDGAAVKPVDVITFGSPCQDLSIAGNQKGIHAGERSSLFFEAIRIIKEMRDATSNQYPRFAVWENVKGAFSSNHGEDFRAVLQAFADIGGGGCIIPEPPKGKWKPIGNIVGNGWSLAWRLYDAQYTGVPQRRERIYLVADFGSERAGEILLECEGEFGDFAPRREAWERITANASGGAGGNCSPCYSINTMVETRWKADNRRTTFCVGSDGDPQFTFQTNHEHAVCYPCIALEGNGARPSHRGSGWKDSGQMFALNTIDRHAVCYDCRGNGEGEVVPTLTGDHQNRVTDYTAIICCASGASQEG